MFAPIDVPDRSICLVMTLTSVFSNAHSISFYLSTWGKKNEPSPILFSEIGTIDSTTHCVDLPSKWKDPKSLTPPSRELPHLHFQCQSTPQYDIIRAFEKSDNRDFGKLKLRLAGRTPEILRHQRTAADKLVCGCINLDTPCCAFIGDCRRSSGGAQFGVSFANQRTRLLGCVRKI